MLPLLACGGSSRVDAPCATADAGAHAPSDGATPPPSMRVPLNHRPSSGTCPPRGPGYSCATDGGADAGGGQCTKDADCTLAPDGRCCVIAPDGSCTPQSSFPGCAMAVCSYNECTSDSDCPTLSPCICGAPGPAGNTCVNGGNCALDSDCGPGAYCSPGGPCGRLFAEFFCHTAEDACVDDSDCGQQKVCNYDRSLRHWVCVDTCISP